MCRLAGGIPVQSRKRIRCAARDRTLYPGPPFLNASHSSFSTSRIMVAQTRAGGKPPSPQKFKLKFQEKLVGRTTTSTDVLLKKLKALHTELAELEQDRPEKDA